MSVLFSFISHLIRLIKTSARTYKVPNAFDVASLKHERLSHLQTLKNIRSRIFKARIWNSAVCDTDITFLEREIRCGQAHRKAITSEDFIQKFDLQARSFLAYAFEKVSQNGTIKVHTTTRAHVMSRACLKALLEKENAQRASIEAKTNRKNHTHQQ